MCPLYSPVGPGSWASGQVISAGQQGFHKYFTFQTSACNLHHFATAHLIIKIFEKNMYNLVKEKCYHCFF